MTEREDKLRRSNPYRVPDGYFSDLRSTLRERIADHEAVNSDADVAVAGLKGWWGSVRSLAVFSAAFGSLVLFAVVGYYFTGYKAQLYEQQIVQEETADILLGYHLYGEDIEELIAYDTTTEEEGNILFAQEVTEYLDTYGYGSTDVSTLIDSD